MEQATQGTDHVDWTELEDAISEAERLVKLLKEANSLAGELASMKITLAVNKYLSK